MAQVVVAISQDSGQQARAHKRQFRGNRVSDTHQFGFRKSKGRHLLLGHKRIVVDLAEAQGAQGVADLPVLGTLMVLLRRNCGRMWRLRGDGSIAHHAAHLFHQVVLDGDIFGGSPRRDGDQQAIGGVFQPKADRGKNLLHFLWRNGTSQFAFKPVVLQVNGSGHREGEIHIPQTASHAGFRTHLQQEFKSAGDGANGVLGVLRFLKAHGRIGAQLQGAGGSADIGRLEVGALKEDAGSADTNSAFLAANHASERDGPAFIGNHQVGWV